MATDQTTQALCHNCRNAMVYVTAMPHPTVRHMRKTTFVCYNCHQTRSYMLSSLMADAYAAVSGRDAKVIAENTPDQ